MKHTLELEVDPSFQTNDQHPNHLHPREDSGRARRDSEETERREETQNVLDDHEANTLDPTSPEEVRGSIHSPQCESLDPTEGEDPPPTAARVDESAVHGREDDRKRVVELLLSDRRCELSVVPIVGIAGVGKTTLAQLVYNDPLVCEHFDARGWACASQDFDMVRLMNAIALSMNRELLFASAELAHIRCLMMQELEGKRFLLVLDDVCNEDHRLWDGLRASLTVGLRGSVVLVTTRNESVARIVQTVPFYHLECLSDDDSWSLFQQCLFGCGRDPTARQSLVPIAKGIVERFRGLPLAVKMIRCLLSSEASEESWHYILHSDLWECSEIVDVSSTAIALSYYSLPAHLRRCFAYCALFPKDCLYKKDPLVRLWMAEGFIQPTERKREEDVGSEYFDELLRRSFFRCSQIDRETFIVHDLVYDFTQSISRKEIRRIEDGIPWSVASDTRHSSLIPREFGVAIQIQPIHEPVALHTFLVIHRLLTTCDVTFISSKDRLRLRIPNGLFTNMEHLRTLDLSESDIVELPDSIGNLKNLRYLGLNHTKIRSLPEALCGLHNLQTLEMHDCGDLVELPRDTKNLINLRHLCLPRYVPMPPGIGLLTNLQTLSAFSVGADEAHCVIAELKDLTNLRGELAVAGIQNVACVDYAEGALKNKEYVTKLMLRSGVRNDSEALNPDDYSIFDGEVEDFLQLQLFSDKPLSDHESQACESSSVDDNRIEQKSTKVKIVVPNEMAEDSHKKKKDKVAVGLEEGVFEVLRPHTNLTELVIQSYYSARFPGWLGDPSFSNLVSVKLDICSECKVLPPLGQLPSLRHLVVDQLSQLESIGHEFYGQDAIVIAKGFPSLETLYFGAMYKWEEWAGAEHGGFPRLRELRLNYCPKLRRMPHLLPSLKKLVMWVCKELTVLPALPSLTHLELWYCNEKIWVSRELLTGLQSLKIHGCKDLACLPLYNLSALTELDISGCVCSPFGLQLSNLASLKSLKIHRCPGIRFTQDQRLPSTLRFVDISYCPLLTEWCLHKHGSSELAHVPRVILDRKDFHPIDDGDTLQT